MQNFSTLFRYLGITFLLAAAINFLLNGKFDFNSQNSFYLLFGLTSSLSFIGTYFAKKYKAIKSARVALGSSLAFIPVQFAQLGAFIYNYGESHLPSFNYSNLIIIPILLGISFLGLKVFAKNSTKNALGVFSVFNMILLVPNRSENFHLITFILMSVVFLCFLIKVEKTEKISLLFLALPVIIFSGRSMYYPGGSIYISILAIFISFIAGKLDKKDFNSIYLPAIIISTFLVFTSVANITSYYQLKPVLGLIFFSLIIFSLSSKYFFSNRGLLITGFVSLLFTGSVCLFTQGAIYSLASILIPVSVLILSYSEKQKETFICSIILLSLSVIYRATHLVELADLGFWIYAIIIGTFFIIISAVFERHNKLIVDKTKSFYNEINSWS